MDAYAGDTECERALWGAIQRLTLEQLGQSILELVGKSIPQVSMPHQICGVLCCFELQVCNSMRSCS